MLPERLSAYLRYFTRLAYQPANRWDGFDLRAPDARLTSLRSQIFFSGCALAALARHPLASTDERSLAVTALADMADRLIQRRVWAAWAAETERQGLKPDPVDVGYGAYSGELAMLFGLQLALGGTGRYDEDPLVLRWSADVRSCYTTSGLVEALQRQLQESPEGALRCEGDHATASGMAAVVWALRLHDLATASGYGALGAVWLKTLADRMAVRGPRLFNRNTLASSFHVSSRRAVGAGDSLEDAWGLALTVPLDRELVAGLAERYWLGFPKLRERGEPLPLAFSYLLAVELGDQQRATDLLAYAEERFDLQEDDEGGRRFTGPPAAPWLTALYAMGEAGGMARLLEAALSPLPAAPFLQSDYQLEGELPPPDAVESGYAPYGETPTLDGREIPSPLGGEGMEP
ncbi:MAG: hypothetical protein HGA65_10520 [Oscillochloris sp.]|nr:hypothetical protein [Oscillochloris sp.]